MCVFGHKKKKSIANEEKKRRTEPTIILQMCTNDKYHIWSNYHIWSKLTNANLFSINGLYTVPKPYTLQTITA